MNEGGWTESVNPAYGSRVYKGGAAGRDGRAGYEQNRGGRGGS